jgi:hypothetical protein
LPAKPVQGWTVTTLREKLVEIGAKVVTHAKDLVFQLAEVAVPRQMFAALPERIGRLRLPNATVGRQQHEDRDGKGKASPRPAPKGEQDEATAP